MDFLDFLEFYGFLDFWIFLIFFGFFWIFFGFFWLVRIPFKVTNFTTKSYQGYYWTPEIAKNGPKQHNNLFFLPKGQKKPRQKDEAQELKVGQRCGPYLLVQLNWGKKPYNSIDLA